MKAVKRILKIILILLVVVVGLGIGFVLTLQIFEFRPKAVEQLSISSKSASNDPLSYVQLNQPIKIVTLNTGYASLSKTEDFVLDGGTKARMDSKDSVQGNVDGMINILTGQNADIYLLQEVDTDSHRSYNIDEYAAYQEALGTTSIFAYNYRCIFVPFPLSFTDMMGKVNSGIATFSSLEITSSERDQLPGSFPWPKKIAYLKRCLMISRLPIQGSDKEMVLINVHMSAYDNGDIRLQEMAYLQTFIDNEYKAGNYVVVGGDFNQTFPNAVYQNYDSVTENYNYVYTWPLTDPDNYQAFPMEKDWFIEHGFKFADDPSTPTNRLLNHPLDITNLDNNQYYVIDGFIVSGNITINSIQTLDEGFTYTDHNPVEVDITLN